MSEIVKGVLDTWEGVDSDVYSRIEYVENINKNNVVSTRTYAIRYDEEKGKTVRKQIKNVHRGDHFALNEAEDKYIDSRGHSPTAYRRYNWDVAKYSEELSPYHADQSHRAWDVSRYGDSSTLEAYLESRGLSDLATGKNETPPPLTERGYFEASDHSPTERILYGKTEKEWIYNTAELNEWEKYAKKLRNKKGFLDLVNDPSIVESETIRAYENFLSQNPNRAEHISLKNGFIYTDPELKPTREAGSGKLITDSPEGIEPVAGKTPTKAELQLPPVILNEGWYGIDPTVSEIVLAKTVSAGKISVNGLKKANFSVKRTMVEFLSGTRMAKERTSRRKVLTGLGVIALALVAYKAGDNHSDTLKHYVDNLWTENQHQQQTIDHLTAQLNTHGALKGSGAEQIPVPGSGGGGSAIHPGSSGTHPGSSGVEVPGAHSGNGGPNSGDLPSGGGSGHSVSTPTTETTRHLFYVERGSGIINETAQYAHNVHHVNLTDSQAQHIYEQLHKEFGVKIIDIHNQSHDTYMVGSDVRLSSEGVARWYSPQVQARVDELIKQAQAS